MDFGAEFREPAKNYQTCYPRVFSQLHSVTNSDNETIAMLNSSAPEVVDIWDTAHIAAYSGTWDKTKEHLQHAGFNTIVDAQLIEKVRGEQRWPHWQGYHDEGSAR
jgi:hypothetical protein